MDALELDSNVALEPRRTWFAHPKRARWHLHFTPTSPQPFGWTKTVDGIITKVKRGRATLDRVTESATHH